MQPAAADVRGLLSRLATYDLVIVGTINAGAAPGQRALVKALMARGTPLVVVALRLPYDLAAFPRVPTFACTYSILPPSMDALADALWGRTRFEGRLPVTIPRA